MGEEFSMANYLAWREFIGTNATSLPFAGIEYSPPQRLEGNKSSVFVDGSSCVTAVAHRNFYSEVEHSNLCQ